MASRSVMMIPLWIIALVFSISRSTEAQCQPKLEIRGRAEKATAMFTIVMNGTSKVGDKLLCFCNGTDVRNLTWHGPKGVLQTRAENNQVFSRKHPNAGTDALDAFLRVPQCDDFGEYLCKYGSLTANATAKPLPGTCNHSIAISVKEEFFVHWEKRIYRATESDRVINLTLVTNSTLTKSITVMAKPATIRRRSPNEGYISFIPGSPIMITYNPLRETFGRASIGLPVDPDDFQDAVYNFIFKAKAKKAQESFQIINDEVLEYDEIAFSQFSFREEDLERYDMHPTDPTVTYIVIEDDDNVMINFSPIEYEVPEDVEVVTLRIEINGQFSRPLSATVGCRDASASNVTDYKWTSLMTFSFESFLGDPPLNRTFDIPIVDDDEYEDVEYFLCEILNTSLPGRFLIDQSRKQANVTITDDDLCPDTLIFTSTPPGKTCTVRCSELSDLLHDGVISAKCGKNELWESLDLSQCMFKENTNPSVNILLLEATENNMQNYNSSLKQGQGYSVVVLEEPDLPEPLNVDGIIVNLTANSSCDCCENIIDVKNATSLTFCIGSSRTTSSCGCLENTNLCITPFVMNKHNKCEIDNDGDGKPDSEDKCEDKPGVCEESADQTTCTPSVDQEWQLKWPEVITGEVALLHCPQRKGRAITGLAKRHCKTDGTWGEVNVTTCISLEFYKILNEAKTLTNGLNVSTATEPLNRTVREAISDITVQLSNLTVPVEGETLLPSDLRTTSFVLQSIKDLGENSNLFNIDKETTDDTIKNLANILSNILDDGNNVAFLVSKKASFDNQPPESAVILRATEGIASVAGRTLTEAKPTITLDRPNFVFHGRRINLESFNDVLFPGNLNLSLFNRPHFIPKLKIPSLFIKMAVNKDSESIPVDDDTNQTMVNNGSMVETIEQRDFANVLLFVMNNMEDYLPLQFEVDNDTEGIQGENVIPGTLLISGQIGSLKAPRVPEHKVIIMFHIKDEVLNAPVPSGKRREYTCVFWNLDANKGTGGWSRSGVTRLNFTETENGTQVTCETVHLTSFVVLVSLMDTTAGRDNLLTYIGCGISLVWLIFSILFFLCLRKELITNVYNYVHLNICIALTFGIVVFLVGIDTATALPIPCKAVTALTHYFFLSVFSWSLCEGVLIYNLLVRVVGAYKRKWILIYTALGWGIPIPAVAVSVGLRHDVYLRRMSFDSKSPSYEDINACWLPTHLELIWAFFGPMILIVVVNAVIIFLSMASLTKNQCRKKSSSKASNKKVIGKRLIWTSLILLPILCFTWVIGLWFIAPGQAGQVFAVLFIVGNVLQGFFIFVLHVLWHEKVCGKIKVSKASSSPSIGKTKTNLYAASTDKSFQIQGLGLIVLEKKKNDDDDDDDDDVSIKEGVLEAISTDPETKNEVPDTVAATSFGFTTDEVTKDEKKDVKEEECDKDNGPIDLVEKEDGNPVSIKEGENLLKIISTDPETKNEVSDTVAAISFGFATNGVSEDEKNDPMKDEPKKDNGIPMAKDPSGL